MKQLKLPFNTEFKKGDMVKILSKSVGNNRMFYPRKKKGYIVRIHKDTFHNKYYKAKLLYSVNSSPRNGSGYYFLPEDLRRIR